MDAANVELVEMFGTGVVFGALASVGPFLFGLAVHFIFGIIRGV